MTATTDTVTEHVDVLVVGAGISGIAAGYHLGHDHPERTYAILEMREATGGTWDFFRYPGLRSDSDLQTFGFAFKPWRSRNTIAEADEILGYLRETIDEFGIGKHIRTGHKVIAAEWSTPSARWTVTAERTVDGETVTLTAGWLFCASGYYDYRRGFAPHFEGAADFAGPIVHPQHWPEDLDYTGKRVVVIGSGATAVTLIPAMAQRAAHMTMLQRSPSYVLALPTEDPIANWLRPRIGEARTYHLTRWKNIRSQQLLYAFCRRFPKQARAVIRRLTAGQLPAGYPVDRDFTPTYDPWDQRLCLVPDGDLFRTISDGDADIVTATIDRFVSDGVRLTDGRVLPADIIVTATGLNLLAFGGIAFTVDGRTLRLGERLSFRASMLSDMPNFSYAIGYTNASWTLKVDLVCENLSRVLSHMDEQHYDICIPRPRPGMETRPLLSFQAGYVLRSLDALPRQGADDPWDVPMRYAADVRRLREDPVTDPGLHFATSTRSGQPDDDRLATV